MLRLEVLSAGMGEESLVQGSVLQTVVTLVAQEYQANQLENKQVPAEKSQETYFECPLLLAISTGLQWVMSPSNMVPLYQLYASQ